MKKYSPLTLAFLLVSMILLLPCCSKDDNDRVSPGKYVGVPPGIPINKHYVLSFFLVDSAGKNIFSDNTASNYPFDPVTFSAHSPWSNSIGNFIPNQSSIGYFFKIIEKLEYIENDPTFQTDTLFELYPCFNQDCDTIVVYPKVYFDNGKMKVVPIQGMFRKLIWGNDTILHDGNNSIFKKHRVF